MQLDTSSNVPKQKRLSIPSPGQTLLANARVWGGPILTAHQRLISTLESKIDLEDCFVAHHSDYGFLNYAGHGIRYKPLTFKLCSAALILNWITGQVLGNLSNNASLIDAEIWYKGKEDNSRRPISEVLSSTEQDLVLGSLRTLEYDSQFVDILPYAVEVFETSEELLTAFGQGRKSKKSSGIFYLAL